LGRKTLPHEQIFGYIGQGAPRLIEQALGAGGTPEECQRGLEFFLNYYREHMLDHTVTHPGVREGLSALEGRSMAVLTNKPVRFSVQLVEGLGLEMHFFRIYGGNSFEEKKPNPRGIQMLIAESAAAPERTIMVGDSAVDVRTARSAHVQSCGVSWGFQPETFAGTPPDFVIDDMSALVERVLG
jgi:phosphoglycolate phosphatase